jgi:hypothetical protein
MKSIERLDHPSPIATMEAAYGFIERFFYSLPIP